MNKPIKAEVVNAFVSSLREIFLASTGIESELAPLNVATSGPPAPNMLVSIQITGGVQGPAICSFEPGVAREIAGRMLATEVEPEFDSPECRDALGELANIIIGNATGTLLDEGYQVELSLPTTALASTPELLDQRSIKVSLNTRSGQVSMLLCLTQS